MDGTNFAPLLQQLMRAKFPVRISQHIAPGLGKIHHRDDVMILGTDFLVLGT
jgi:hypothetical protein